MHQDEIVWENNPPFYKRPLQQRLDKAINELLRVEEYIAPDHPTMFSFLVRVLMHRGFTVAEAMWAVYAQIQEGRYIAETLSELDMRGETRGPYNEQWVPAGLKFQTGTLHIDDGSRSPWGVLTVTRLREHHDESRGVGRLDLKIDLHQHTVSRRVDSKWMTVELTNLEWNAFIVFYNAGEDGATLAQWKNGYCGEWDGRHAVVSELRSKLEGLGITVEKRKRCIIELPT
jgi:hypothetical protein